MQRGQDLECGSGGKGADGDKELGNCTWRGGKAGNCDRCWRLGMSEKTRTGWPRAMGLRAKLGWRGGWDSLSKDTDSGERIGRCWEEPGGRDKCKETGWDGKPEQWIPGLAR